MGRYRTPFVTLGLDPRARGAAAPSGVGGRRRAGPRLILGSSPRMTVAGLMAFGSLAACSQANDKPEPTPSEKVAAAPVAASDAVAAAPVVLDASGLKRVCKAGLAAIHGQAVDAAGFEGQTADAVRIEGLEGTVVTASWPAPVDGGRMRAQCKVEGDLIAWKPLDRPVADQNRWMTQSGDPEVRFVMDGDKITITQTLPDGAKQQSELTVPIEEEAA